MAKRKPKKQPTIKETDYLAEITPLWRYVVRYLERTMWQTTDDIKRSTLKKAVTDNEDAFISLGIKSVTFCSNPDSDEKITAQAEKTEKKLHDEKGGAIDPNAYELMEFVQNFSKKLRLQINLNR